MQSNRRREVVRLVELMDGDGPPLVITGSRGAGKTNLCEGLSVLLSRGSRHLVDVRIERGGQACYDESLVDDFERKAVSRLRQTGAKYRILRSRSEKEGPALPCLEVEGAKLFVVIDGLDHLLAEKGLDASFLPMEIPRSMRLAVSVSHGPIAEALAARGWQVHEVAPLGRREIRAIAQAQLNGHEKQSELVEALLAWPPGKHPSHLILAGALAAVTGAAPAPADDVAAVATRLVDQRGPQPEEAALLAVCKYGIPRVTGLDVGVLFRLQVLEPAVVTRRGFFEPATPEVRQALRARVTEEQLRTAHGKAFELHGETHLPPLFQAAAEHLLEIGGYERLADFLTQLEPFQSLINRDAALVERCWRSSGLRDGPQRYQRMLDTLVPGAGVETRVALINNVGLLAGNMGWNELGEQLKRRALTEATEAFLPTQGKVGTALLNLAIQLGRDVRHDAEVESIYQRMLATIDGPVRVDENYPSKWLTLRSLATHVENRARYDEGLAHRDAGIEAARRALGDKHPIVAMELLWASRAIRWRLPGRALAYAEQAHALLLAALGPKSDRVVFALRLIAAAELELGRAERSLHTSLRAATVGQELASTHPFECAYALEHIVGIADAMDDRRLALQRRQEHYQYLRAHLGPNHTSTLSAGWSLALACEADGQTERALDLVEDYGERQKAMHGPTYWDTLDAMVVAARLCWLLGRRAEAERRLTEAEKSFDAATYGLVRGMALLLRSEWAREDRQGNLQQEFLEKACQLYQEADIVDSRAGLFHVLLGGIFHLRGDAEASARHHEAGAALLDDVQRHLQPLALRPYQASLWAGVAESRQRELCTTLAVNVSRPGIDRAVLPVRAVRAAWNPGDGRTLAVLDQGGGTHIFLWHAEAGQLERLDVPFANVKLPRDLASFTLRWSDSGQSLRLTTPDDCANASQPACRRAWKYRRTGP